MSLVKVAPKHLKDRKCKALYFHIPKKDCAQETVSVLKAERLKAQIGKGAELQAPIWQSGTLKAFLIQAESALDAIKKKGPLKAHGKAHETYMKQRKLVKQAKATLAKLDGATSEGIGSSKRSSKKHKEAAGTAGTPGPDLQTIYQLDLKKAKKATEKAKVKSELAAQEMFQLYANLLSIDAKYAWNKNVQEQTKSNP
jgi:hypothetical protein